MRFIFGCLLVLSGLGVLFWVLCLVQPVFDVVMLYLAAFAISALVSIGLGFINRGTYDQIGDRTFD